MSRRFAGARLAAALLLALAAPALSTSCQSLAGIEARDLGPCGEFCDTVMHNCTGDNQVYETRAKCLAVCQLLEPGDPTDPEPQGSDTVACRLREARLATNAAAEAVTEHCRSAGPEGLNCGGACENYCTLYEKACHQVQCGSHANCVEKCAALRNRSSFNIIDDYDGDSLQCRFVHLTNAAVGPAVHCGHGQLATPTDHCNDLPDAPDGSAGSGDAVSTVKPSEPQCADYCRVVSVACQGPDRQYESEKQCLALCPYFAVGAFADTTENTLGCRLYHSYNSLCSPANHCPHAGPGGEGHCGTEATDKCAAYCRLAHGVCPSEYADHFDSDDACAAACADLPDARPTDTGDTRYLVDFAATKGTLACRFLALSRAAEQASLCGSGAAFGEGDCAP